MAVNVTSADWPAAGDVGRSEGPSSVSTEPLVVAMKLEALVVESAVTVMPMGPVVTPAGTTTDSVVVVAVVTVAGIPLNTTVLFAGTALKLVPVIVTAVPDGPYAGVKLVIVGGVVTVKLLALVAVCDPTLIVIGPVLAPGGTLAVSCVIDAAVTVAVMPLNFTVLLAAIGLKNVPLRVTGVPMGPDDGEKSVIEGGEIVNVGPSTQWLFT